MRERLAEQKSKISIRDAIREIRGDIEKIFWMLRNTNTSASEGGGATEWMKTATTKAGLEEPVSEVFFGRVTDGAQQGMVCVRNPDNDGWDALNFFE